jgi:hypothetical protein
VPEDLDRHRGADKEPDEDLEDVAARARVDVSVRGRLDNQDESHGEAPDPADAARFVDHDRFSLSVIDHSISVVRRSWLTAP